MSHHTPAPGPATPDRTWSDRGPKFTNNRMALLDRGYQDTAPVPVTRHRYGVSLVDLPGPKSGADFTAPVFRVLPDHGWLIISDFAELDALAADLRDRFAFEAIATREFVAQFPGGW